MGREHSAKELGVEGMLSLRSLQSLKMTSAGTDTAFMVRLLWHSLLIFPCLQCSSSCIDKGPHSIPCRPQ